MDKGALWENFLVSERLKQHIYKESFSKLYFWRTKHQKEIYLVEEKDGLITAYELTWDNKKCTSAEFYRNIQCQGIRDRQKQFQGICENLAVLCLCRCLKYVDQKNG